MSTKPGSAPYVDGLGRHELRYQSCEDCGAAQTLSRHACRRCASTRLGWQRAGGQGVVYATTTVARAPSAAFRTLVPYTLAIVELDEGARVMGHASPGIAIGERVVAGFFEFEGHTLLKFRPAN